MPLADVQDLAATLEEKGEVEAALREQERSHAIADAAVAAKKRDAAGLAKKKLLLEKQVAAKRKDAEKKSPGHVQAKEQVRESPAGLGWIGWGFWPCSSGMHWWNGGGGGDPDPCFCSCSYFCSCSWAASATQLERLLGPARMLTCRPSHNCPQIARLGRKIKEGEKALAKLQEEQAEHQEEVGNAPDCRRRLSLPGFSSGPCRRCLRRTARPRYTHRAGVQAGGAAGRHAVRPGRL